jgi:hypothetical protein
MADHFDETVGKLAKIAVAQIPVLGLVVEAVSAFLPPNADERLKEAVGADLGDKVAQLHARVEQLRVELERQGKHLEELGAIRTTNVSRIFAMAVTEATSPGKVAALVNAAARQFDPTFGTPAARSHWFSIVRSLSDIELQLILLAHEHGSIAFDGKPFHVNLHHKTAAPIDEIGLEDTIALEGTAQESISPASTLHKLVGQRSEMLTQSAGKKWQTMTFGLTPAGQCVARLIAH